MSVTTAHHCNGCGAEVESYEEGRCAFCRMEDRGDDQLLAHDSRGYLDVDGKTRVPCGCGCGKAPMIGPPRDPLLDVVRDIVGHGERVEIRLPVMPVKWRADWIERLGGVIVIDPDAVMPLAMQRDKGNGGGREALAAMDRGEPQCAERSDMANEQKPRGWRGIEAWTPEAALTAIQDFAEKHGHPPQGKDCLPENGLPHSSTLGRLFGSFGDAIERAGFPKPKRGQRYETIAPAESGASGNDPEPPEETGPDGDLEPIAPPPLPAPRDPDKVDVFEVFETLATDERIEFYEEVSHHALVKAAALRQIQEALGTLRETEA